MFINLKNKKKKKNTKNKDQVEKNLDKTVSKIISQQQNTKKKKQIIQLLQ